VQWVFLVYASDMAIEIIQLPLPQLVEGDTWKGIKSIKVENADFVTGNPLLSARAHFRSQPLKSAPIGASISTDLGSISILSSDPWIIRVEPTNLGLAAGTWFMDLEFQPTSMGPFTVVKGTLMVVRQITDGDE
jgi:hypothetical protein